MSEVERPVTLASYRAELRKIQKLIAKGKNPFSKSKSLVYSPLHGRQNRLRGRRSVLASSRERRPF